MAMAMSMAEEERSLVRLCIESATESAESVDKWRRQRRTLERMPSHLSSPLLHRLLHRRILSPSLLEVFQHSVEEVDLKGENCVDAEWMSYIGGFRHLRALNLAGCRGITNSALWPITGMTNLVDLDLSRCSKITDACIGHLLSISNLKKLYLSETSLTTDGVRNLSCLKSLCVLDLGGLPVTDTALFWFQELTELEHLELWGSKISNRGAAVLETFPKLSFLNVAWTDVTHLPMLPSLTCLNISRCNIHSIYGGELNVTVPLSKLLASGTTFLNINLQFAPVEADDLSYIDLSGSSVDNFHFLGHMKALEHLNLSFGAMSDDLMWPLSRIGEKLRYLNLNNTRVTKIGMCIISSNVPVLETLLLSHTSVDDDALLYIHSMPSLREIDLSNTKIKGFTLSLLQNLTHLQSLNLEQTLVTDKALHLLSVLQELKCLYLKSEILSDVSLHVLSSLPKLTSIGFCGTVLSNADCNFLAHHQCCRFWI
ncbi:hypothetical protein QJS10_CPB20g02019 [Acorus calamus]|uniref:Uncharacterized protein n=1 Tax=Acorus calamus TaxID=4465 RepID=A0AAV9CCY2_ACOCL|nr:hypothetical protein QJS10_CPB20g02019 [Acorus calamus]